MEFTFGIITSHSSQNFLPQIISDIKSSVPKLNREIIVIGGSGLGDPDVIHVPFNENVKRAWITKKKNLITENSTKENIVYMHDYLTLMPNWYEGQIKKGNDFHIRMDKIVNYDGTRFRDWSLWPHNDNRIDDIVVRECLIPYSVSNLTKYMYISGTYWIAKKSIMIENPLNEELSWGEGEDVQWSKKVRAKYTFQMNTNSSVKILKPGKDRVFGEIRESTLKSILEYVETLEKP